MPPIDRRSFLKQSGATSAGFALGQGSAPQARSVEVVRGHSDPRLEIHLPNIAFNLAQIRKRVGSRPVMAVIKANAYGHGLVAVGNWLAAKNVGFLAVGKLWEGVLLREHGVKTPILNLGPCFSADEAREIVRHDIIQTVHGAEYHHLAEAARKAGRTAKVHLKVDTGLGRVGVPHGLALPFIERVAANKEIRIGGIYTTLTEDPDHDKVQLRRFAKVCEAATTKGIRLGLRHAASSAGILANQDAWLDMVRPGVTLYGHYPSTKEAKLRQIELRPAMSLKTRVMYVKTLLPGDSVSYHRAFVAKKETRLATLAVGYSDGYPHRAAGKAQVILGGKRFPSVALVTSNHMTVDVTGATDDVRSGQEVVLFGSQGDATLGADEVAAWAGTSVYKVLIGMSPLLPRKVMGGS
ncbi:MAG: alanine racemase [Planctomycetota bacterium]|jgi:alanine racemase